MDFIDYYKILQLPHTAKKDEIKTAYRQLAKTTPPDKNHENNQATSDFQMLNDAYSTLSDTRNRRIYDLEYEQQTRSYLPPCLTEVRTNTPTNCPEPFSWSSDTLFGVPSPKPIRVDMRQVEQFIRQFKSCVYNADRKVGIQKQRIKQKEGVVRALEEEIFTAGFEMIEIYECGAGPSNLERTRQYSEIQEHERCKAEMETKLKEEEEKLAGLEKQLQEFSSRLSYWEKERENASGRKS